MKKNVKGIDLWVLGDFGPFSRTGKSIGYKVSIGGHRMLVDCGAPLFDILGGESLLRLDAVLLTHCHDDHKRWFTDLALYHRYAPKSVKRLMLIATENVLVELIRSAMPALDMSLSLDSSRVVDIAFDEYVDVRAIGPRAKYHIERRGRLSLWKGNAKSASGLYDLGAAAQEGSGSLQVTDINGNHLGPDRAKVVINPVSGRPRMLFRDPASGEWVEPSSFYGYGSEAFYEADRRPFEGDGFRVEAVKAHFWHGLPGSGYKFSTSGETLFFASDTVHDLDLWGRLVTEKRPINPGMSASEFDKAEVIYGDINDYIERTWSHERLTEARNAFEGCFVVHDIANRQSVVHTDYERLEHTVLHRDSSILTHSPDHFTSTWPLCFSDKRYRLKGRKIMEAVGGELLPMDADIYHKETGKFFAGYLNPKGKYTVEEHSGNLKLTVKGPQAKGTKSTFKVDLFEDVGGEYYPVLDTKGVTYRKRHDGKVELVRETKSGSLGKVIQGVRAKRRGVKGKR